MAKLLALSVLLLEPTLLYLVRYSLDSLAVAAAAPPEALARCKQDNETSSE